MIEVGSRSVRLSWKRPFDGNSPVLGYVVQYQSVGALQNHEWDHAGTFNVTLPVSIPGTLT